SSTDAAAVFSLLHNKATSLNERVTSVLEIESGTNDPMAIVLTIGLLTYLESHGQFTALQFLWLLLEQMAIGGAVGLGGGWLLTRAINRLDLNESLYPVFALFGGFLLFGLTALLGGSGFLAVYLGGLVLGNRRVRALAGIRRFHDGIAWMAQIGMFLMLGLLVSPHRLWPVSEHGLLIALMLTLVARPLAVAMSLLPFRMAWREQLFIAWVGLRGSVPIVLATFPWIAGIPNAGLIFNITFFIVLASLVVQGWSVPWAARLLGLLMPRMHTRIHRMDIDLPGQRGYEIFSYRLPESSAHLGKKPKELPVRDHSRVISISRGGRMLAYREWGVLQAGDYISLLAAEADLEKLDAVFQSRRPRGKLPGTQQFFGEFAVAPEASARDLADSYNVPLPAGTEQLNVAELILRFLPRPVVGDKLRLGSLELVVRHMDGRALTQIGIRLPRE
ncbi:MAG: potassium/proton antiporter, partial [Stenotrophobium sp.]